MISIVLLLSLTSSITWDGVTRSASTRLHQEQTGDLTLIVRDQNGQPLSGVGIALIHDTDNGRIELGEETTDATGSITYPDLPWGMYIVQFRGHAPNQQPILSPEHQNLGLLSDGNGLDNGFGVRFADSSRTELFVLKLDAGERAIPMFDNAPNPDASPQPVDPLLEQVQGNVASPVLVETDTERTRSSGLILLSGWLILMILTLMLGVWRERQTRQLYDSRERKRG